MKYNFAKNVNTNKINDELQGSSIFSLIVSIVTSNNKTTFEFSRDLTEEEYKVLYETILKHRESDIVYNIIQNRIDEAMLFGRQLLIDFATENVLRGISIQQTKALTQKFSIIQSLLMNGSLYSALDEINKLSPDEWIRQQDIDSFKVKIRTFLNI